MKPVNCVPSCVRIQSLFIAQVLSEFDEDKPGEIAAVNSASNNGLNSKLGSFQGHGAVYCKPSTIDGFVKPSTVEFIPNRVRIKGLFIRCSRSLTRTTRGRSRRSSSKTPSGPWASRSDIHLIRKQSWAPMNQSWVHGLPWDLDTYGPKGILELQWREHRANSDALGSMAVQVHTST